MAVCLMIFTKIITPFNPANNMGCMSYVYLRHYGGYTISEQHPCRKQEGYPSANVEGFDLTRLDPNRQNQRFSFFWRRLPDFTCSIFKLIERSMIIKEKTTILEYQRNHWKYDPQFQREYPNIC